MATISTPIDALSRSHGAVGTSYFGDGSPVVVGMWVGVSCRSNRPPTVPE